MSNSESLLRPTVAAAVATLFIPEDQEIITKMLIEKCNAERLYTSSVDLAERVKLAVFKISDGNIDNF